MSTFPESLRAWRKNRRYSQLDLSLEADVSARHISFLETGRAQPSREMISRLGETLHIPKADLNSMLTQAGFAARYPARLWDDAEMAPIRSAVDYMLRSHMPYPALALDRLWTIVEMNGMATQLFGMLGAAKGDSLLEVMQADHVPAMIENWPVVAHSSARRLRVESAAQGGVPALGRAADALSRAPQPMVESSAAVLPTVFVANGQRLSLFATIAQFGTPEDVLLDDLKIEMYFPADEETAATLRAMSK